MEVIEIQIPLWGPKWNKEALEVHLQRVGVTAFNRGLRNIALSNKDRTFPSFERCLNPDKTVSEILDEEKYNVFCGIDLSSKKRPGTCIFSLAKTLKTKKLIPIDIRLGRWTGPKLLENIVAVQKLYQPRSFLVENNALQDMVIDFLKEYSKKAEVTRKPFIKGHYTGTNKNEEFGLGSIELDFFHQTWVIPYADKVDHKLNCKCGFCVWKNEIIGHPLCETTDCLMASWLARENSRKSSVGQIRLL